MWGDIIPEYPLTESLIRIIRAQAGFVKEDGSLFLIGPYGAALRLDAEKYLGRIGFRYSDLRVDGSTYQRRHKVECENILSVLYLTFSVN